VSYITAVWPVVTTGASAKTATDFTESNGSTSYGTFYWYLVGIKGSNYYRLGSVAAVVNLAIPGNTDTEIFNSTLNAAGASSNQSASGTLAASESWAWDDECDLEATVADWTGFTEYDLGTTPP